MQCPFPGMDPYIERPALWADFHDALISEIRGVLQPLLRPKYAALMQDRLYVVESQRPIYPDVAVVRTSSARKRAPNGVASVAELDRPAVFKVVQDEVREPYIEIIETAAGNRLVTAIELLSPGNKIRGSGRRQYLKKRKEICRSRANFVEIDLLRAGKSTLRLASNDLATLQPWCYLAGVLRRPNTQEVYAIPLQTKLPTIGIPLKRKDKDVPLDLQTVFTHTWEKGPYPELLRYEDPPPGEMTDDELAWCEHHLRRAGYRSKKSST